MMTYPANSTAGPSRHSGSLSSSPKKTFYPSWPETHDEAEYFEIPPDHFLAQQRGPNKTKSHGISELANTRRASTSSVSTINDAHMPIPGLSTASEADTFSSPSSSPQPLSELLTAVQAGIPAAPSSVGHRHNPLDRLADAVPRPAGFSTVDEQIPDTSTLAAADFDVDVRSGFLPPEAPVQRLSGLHADHWEHALDEAKRIPLMQGGGGIKTTPQQRFLARRWRRSIREMPVLPLSDELANDIRFARRGHVVLSFLAHFYIHSQPRKAVDPSIPAPARSWLNVFSRKSAEEMQDEQDLADELAGKFARRVPAAIAVPWIQLSQKLDLPPVLTYATTVLWNWDYIDAARGLEPDNLRIVETFTGTPSEHQFFFTSLLIEARGVEALDLMRVSLDEAFVADRVARRRIAGYLNKLAGVINDLTKLLHDVRNGCDPKIFYWGIRPWFVGSDTPEKGEEPGWHFEGVDPEGVKRVFSGPSAGQSSMIHAIDVFLDVDHTRRKERLNRPAATAIGDARGADATFMERMSLYMPGHHRAFLSHLRNISFDDADDEDLELEGISDDGESDEDVASRELPHPIRSLALKSKLEEHDEGLPAAYDNALGALKGLRDEHMKIAYLYIVAQARGSPPDAYAPLPKGFTGEPSVDKKLAAKAKADAEAEADAALDTNSSDDGGGAKGTGGTDLVSFLRDCRVNTIDALIMAKDAVVASGATLNPASGSGSSSGQSTSPLPGQSSSSEESENKADQNSQADIVATNRPSLLQMPEQTDLQIWAVDISGSTNINEQQLNDLVEALLAGTANAADRAKVSKYYRQVDRIRSFVARILPRLLISHRFNVPWDSIKFGATPEGRPFLHAPSDLPWRVDFNISHDSDYVVLAYTIAPASSEARVGVDVMALALPKYEQDVKSFAETMDMALTAAERRWVVESGSEQVGLRRLYKLWTYKEAYTKNVGKGLGFDFSRLEFHQEKLMVDGRHEPGFEFVDILLPQADKDAASQLVVCVGPKSVMQGEEGFERQVDAAEAESMGILHMLDLETLIKHAKAAASL